MLIIVPTPIGNLKDITFRAIEILKSVDLILAEDTRVTKRLLQHYEISTNIQSYHAHNEHYTLDRWIDMMAQGTKIALVSDAGTPGISDPGFLIARACMQKGIPVECLPGPTAFVPALVASGIACDKFFFEGFLPQKKGRQTRLKFIAGLENTIVIYESPHTLVKCISQLVEYFGEERLICVARELSKMYEEIKTGTTVELLQWYQSKTSVKGEIVIIIEGKKS